MSFKNRIFPESENELIGELDSLGIRNDKDAMLNAVNNFLDALKKEKETHKKLGPEIMQRLSIYMGFYGFFLHMIFSNAFKASPSLFNGDKVLWGLFITACISAPISIILTLLCMKSVALGEYGNSLIQALRNSRDNSNTFDEAISIEGFTFHSLTQIEMFFRCKLKEYNTFFSTNQKRKEKQEWALRFFITSITTLTIIVFKINWSKLW